MRSSAEFSPARPPEVLLPALFVVTHPTSGLAGYPARDFFGPPRAPVRVDFGCRVERLSGRPCHLGGRPGGAYGRSVYLRRPNGDRYFATHLTALVVQAGDWLARGDLLGFVCDSAFSGKPGTSHVHLGRNRAG